MNNYKLLTVFVISFYFLCIPLSSAQEVSKVAIEIEHSGDDIVGARFVYNIKEMIRKSSALKLTYSDESRIKMIIITITYDDRHPSTACVYSVTWTLSGTWRHKGNEGVLHPLYLTGVLGTCGSDRVESVAESIVAKTDELAEDYLFIFND